MQGLLTVMNTWQPLLSRVERRLQSEWRVRRERASRKVWDLLYTRSLDSELSASLLYSSYLPSTTPLTDPIRTDPTLHADPMPGRHHYAYWLRHKAYIEPELGYTIVEPFSIVDDAFARAECLRDPDRQIYYPGTPSLWKLMLAKRGLYPVRKEPVVVSLRGGFDDNIYHIYSDLLPRLALLDEQGIDPSIPVVISPSPMLRKVLDALARSEYWSHRKWIVQRGFYIEADQVIFARADDGTKEQIDHVIGAATPAPCRVNSPKRRIFVTRAGGVGRGLLNMEEIEPILHQFGFEICDPGVMTVEEQSATFGNARIIVGLHGAGLTNIVFRGNRPLRLLEILPPYRVPLCFYAIARKYGFDYDYVVGSGTPSDNLGMKYSYCLDPALLHAKLVRLCKDDTM